jgi:peptidoglycan/LPS O-acetylase OafA/YrhL
MERAIRSDIQGLRAVAILLVVLGHRVSAHWRRLPGFVGVDSFFVLSKDRIEVISGPCHYCVGV